MVEMKIGRALQMVLWGFLLVFMGNIKRFAVEKCLLSILTEQHRSLKHF